MVYKVLRRIQQPQPGTPGCTPSLFDKCTEFFYMRYKTHGTNGFTSHPKLLGEVGRDMESDQSLAWVFDFSVVTRLHGFSPLEVFLPH